MLQSKVEFISAELKKENSDIFSLDFIKELPSTLEILGESDGKIRDELGWMTLSRYFQDKRFSAVERKKVAEVLLGDEFLFFKLDEGESPASVKRTFTLLTLADLVWGDHDFGVTFDESFMSLISRKLREYLSGERDFRGFDESLGWVHSYAHAGDLFVAINRHPNTNKNEILTNIKFILDLIEKREFNVFKWDEHGRLATSIGAGISLLEGKERLNLFKKFSREMLQMTPARQNLLNTFRSLYVDLHINGFEDKEFFEMLKKIVN